MESRRMMHELLAHPAFPPGPALRLRASAGWLAAGRLELRYELAGEVADLRIPEPAAAPRRRDGLWQHSCCELFLRRSGQPNYLECNFAPSGDWAAWLFSDQRSGALALELAAPHVSVQRVGDSALALEVALTLPEALLAAPPPRAGPRGWQAGLCAVLETVGGQLSYWALAHPRPQPDFHDAGGQLLALPEAHDDTGSTA